MTDQKLVLPKDSYNGKVVIDTRGRKITLKQPTALDQYLLDKLCEGEGKFDEHLKMYANAFCYLDYIDGKKIELPTSKAELKLRLNDFYLEDLGVIMREVFSDREKTEEEIKK